LHKLINRLNKEGGDEAHVLREILAAIQKFRQNNKAPNTYRAKLPSAITVDLTDYTSHIRNELAEALADIDPPDLIDRIRECPVSHCGDLFWAGRGDKKACDKHVAGWRKTQNRRDIKQRKTVAATKRRKQKATETFDQMNRTAQSVIRAIMASGARKFTTIDGYSWHDFNDDDLLPRSTWVVRNVTHSLYKDGYLTYHESAERRDRRGFSNDDRYYPTPKLTELWNDKAARIPKQS
jgi:hypothetical protein